MMKSMLTATFIAAALATTIGISLCIAIDLCSCCWDCITELVSVLLLLTSFSLGLSYHWKYLHYAQQKYNLFGFFSVSKIFNVAFWLQVLYLFLIVKDVGSSMMLSCGWKTAYCLLQYFTSSYQTDVNQTGCVLSWKQTTHCFANIEFHVSRPSFISWCNKLHI